jgi:UDP-3-O-[3-hydroxymyristoyl] glucosamine N-acyltransferase
MFGHGFGYTRNDKGELVGKETNGSTIIGKDVNIGINSVIDNGSYRDTVIGKGTKIDNLCHIAHNALIGEHVLIIAGTVVGGSVEIGSYSYIGMNVSIKDHIKIGKHVIVGAGSVVIEDIPDYDVVAGNPAKSIKSKVTIDDEARWHMVGI